MNFKNHNNPGFTFIESLFSVFIVGLMLSSLLLLAGSVFSELSLFSNRLERIFILDNILKKAEQLRFAKSKETVPAKQEIKNPPTTIEYNLRAPNRNSALNKFEHIKIEQANAQWTSGIGMHNEILIHLVYIPEKNKG